MARRRAVIAGFAVATATAASLTVGSGVAAARPTARAAAAPAPVAVSAAARSGGRVIVTLRQQYPSLQVKRDAATRVGAVRRAQRPLLAELAAGGATDVRQLVSVDAIAARVPSATIRRLSADPAVASIERDAPVLTPARPALHDAAVSQRLCPADPARPLLEPEALGLTHFRSQPAAAGDAARIATGAGVKVGLSGINGIAGNPNLIRPDGQHVVIGSPTPNADDGNVEGGGDEWYGDASSVAAQGTVTYDFAKELPYSHLPVGCTFRIEGIAPGASLVDTGFFGQHAGAATGTPHFESEVIAGLDHAAITDRVSVVSESYGYGSIPGQTSFPAVLKANDALVAAGITVVESSGDSGVGGTVELPAYDPLVIDAGATNSLRLTAQAWGYRGWENDQMTALSSGGTTPDNRVVDLVAPGFGGEAICSPKSASCPQNTLTEAFGGTSQSAPFIAGAAADVIQAYSDSHRGARPTPAQVKQVLTGTARDIGAPSEEQGAGLLDVYAAVLAAQQLPGATTATGASTAALVPSPTQLNVTGNGGASSTPRVSLYNASRRPATVHAAMIDYSPARQFGPTTTEAVSAPPADKPLPPAGAEAAAPVSMSVPAGLSQLGVDMITPNPRNDAILSLLLFDPRGRLSQISYDYSSTDGKVSNNEHVSIDRPMAGTWTARVVWNNGRSHLQEPTPVPGKYRGSISVRFTGRHLLRTPFGPAVTIPARGRRSIGVPVTLPSTPGDAPLAVSFTASNGAVTSLPVTRRTLVPSTGGRFATTLGSSVARDFGPLKTFKISVPKGMKDLRVTFHDSDPSPNNVIDYFLVQPNGFTGFSDRTPGRTVQGVGSGAPGADAAIVVADPPAGVWTIQVMMDLVTSGRHFTQRVTGAVAYDTARVVRERLPSGLRYSVSPASKTPVSVSVTNTTGIGRTFRLRSRNGDITGPGAYVPAGATVLVRGILTAPESSGIVRGRLYVVSNSSGLGPVLKADGFRYGLQTLAALPYAYTIAG